MYHVPIEQESQGEEDGRELQDISAQAYGSSRSREDRTLKREGQKQMLYIPCLPLPTPTPPLLVQKRIRVAALTLTWLPRQQLGTQHRNTSHLCLAIHLLTSLGH